MSNSIASGGILPAGVFVPATGPRGVLPAQSLKVPGVIPPRPISTTGVLPPAEALPDRGLPLFSRLGQAANQRIKSAVMPPVAPGQGYMWGLQRQIRAMDVVNGMDQTMGKTQTITLGKRRQMNQVFHGPMSAKEANGPMSGRLERMFA